MEKILEVHDFKSEKYLVTGAAGFIGSNICIELISRGANVIGIDNLSFGSLQSLEEIIKHPNFRFQEIDILSELELINIMNGVDFVIHQAALASVSKSFENPYQYYLHNLFGSINVINAARISCVKKVVYASSSSVYGDSNNLPITENDTGIPLSPYAHSKKMVEEFAESFSSLYDLSLVGLRYFNVYGPKQDFSRQYPAVISSFLSNVIMDNQIIIFGDGLQSRDFVFVTDVVYANILACIINNDGHSIYNVATGEAFNLMNLIEIIEQLVSKKIKVIYRESRKGDIYKSLANIVKINQELKFEPLVNVKNGIKQTYNYLFSKLK
jgi:UDP-N-acetylglucosamine/UDP-N-acetylgalactosamine 4-epimerase